MDASTRWCLYKSRFSDLAAPSSSRVSRFEKVEKDLEGKELKILGQADAQNKGGALERAGQWGFTLAALLKPTKPAAQPQSHRLVAPPPRASLKPSPPPQPGVDPQLYVTITISIIIVLVATGIIFKFW